MNTPTTNTKFNTNLPQIGKKLSNNNFNLNLLNRIKKNLNIEFNDCEEYINTPIKISKNSTTPPSVLIKKKSFSINYESGYLADIKTTLFYDECCECDECDECDE